MVQWKLKMRARHSFHHICRVKIVTLGVFCADYFLEAIKMHCEKNIV